MSGQPKLTPLHDERNLSVSKLSIFKRMTTEALKRSLDPGQEHSLKARPDGTMLDGHHRVHLLRERGEDVDGLPREVIVQT